MPFKKIVFKPGIDRENTMMYNYLFLIFAAILLYFTRTHPTLGFLPVVPKAL